MSYTKKYLEKVEHLKNLDYLHCLDTLTGVLNRDSIIQYIQQLIHKNIPFSLYILDIDNFKLYNDELGHQNGDQILRIVSSRLRNNSRNQGLVGRFGGDEFLIVNTVAYEYDDVWKFSKNIVDEFRIQRIPALENSYVTVTMGSVAFPKDGQTYDDLFSKSDKALYRGKQKGRNCFIIYDDKKHAKIDTSERSSQINEMMDYMFELFTDRENLLKRMRSLCFYIDNYFNVSSYFISKKLITTGLNYNAAKPILPPKRDFFMDVLQLRVSFYINDFSILQDISTDFHSFCWDNKIKSFVVLKVSAFDKDFGYLLFANYSIKRVWQQEDKVLFSYLSKLISLMLYYEKDSSIIGVVDSEE